MTRALGKALAVESRSVWRKIDGDQWEQEKDGRKTWWVGATKDEGVDSDGFNLQLLTSLVWWSWWRAVRQAMGFLWSKWANKNLISLVIYYKTPHSSTCVLVNECTFTKLLLQWMLTSVLDVGQPKILGYNWSALRALEAVKWNNGQLENGNKTSGDIAFETELRRQYCLNDGSHLGARQMRDAEL